MELKNSQAAFTAKLKSSLQIQDTQSIGDLSADSLGIDSLVAVDIRSWFIKELQVDIPVLKILSGATVGEILVRAQELLPRTMTPKLDPSAERKQSSFEHAKLKPTQGQVSVERKNPQFTSKNQPLKSIQPSPPQRPTSRETSETEKVQSSLSPTIALAMKSEKPVSAKLPELTSSVITKNMTRLASRLTETSDIIQDPMLTFLTPTAVSELDTENQSKPTDSTSLSTSSSEQSDYEQKEETLGSSRSSNVQLESEFVSDNQVIKRHLLGFGQSRFWFLRQYIKDPTTFNIAVSIQLNGPLDVKSLDRAVRVVGQHHEALRTRFVTDETALETVQEILAVSTLALEWQDISTEKEAVEAYQKVKSHNFNIEEGENMRILLLKRPNRSFQLIIGYHHINMDGVSLEVVLKDLQMAYDAKPLNPRTLQYPDFSEQQRRDFESGVWRDDLAFWRTEFADIPSPLPLLPMSKTFSRPNLTAYATNSAEMNVGSTLLQSIQTACQKLKVTRLHFYVAVFYTMLIRLVDVDDVCIGVSSANRAGTDMMQSVGLYLNLLPLHFRSNPTQTFTNILKTVRDKSLAAFSHSKVPFDVVVNELGVPRSAAHSPLFQVLVNYRAGVAERRTFCDCDSNVEQFESGQAPYDLSLDVIDSPDENCHIILAGQSVLYSDHDVNLLKDVYLNLLTAFAGKPAMRLSSPSLYAAEEVEKAIRLGRGRFFDAA